MPPKRWWILWNLNSKKDEHEKNSLDAERIIDGSGYFVWNIVLEP